VTAAFYPRDDRVAIVLTSQQVISVAL
jgi:hypothetical protein